MCKKKLDETNFSKDKSSYDGLDHRCRKCNSERGKLYRLRRREYFKKNNENIHKKYRSTNLESQKIWRSKNNEKILAHQELHRAIKFGEIEKSQCVICKNKNAHAHHDDYSKPLEVDWLCRNCHGLWHRILNEWKRQKESGRFLKQINAFNFNI